MATSDLNTMTRDDWKRAREAAGVEKTPWWKGSGPSVGEKLEKWQEKRDAAKAFVKVVGADGYVFKKDDASKVKDANNALDAVHKALIAMLVIIDKEVAKDATNAALKAFQTQVKDMRDDAHRKMPKWAMAVVSFENLGKSTTAKMLQDWSKSGIPGL